MKRILVTGSRDWSSQQIINNELYRAWLDFGGISNEPNSVLVSGACPTGADLMAEQSWGSGVGDDRIERHPAKWDELGKKAGFVRNKEMVDLGADICLAFIRNESKGATHTANLAIRAGVETRIFRE